MATVGVPPLTPAADAPVTAAAPRSGVLPLRGRAADLLALASVWLLILLFFWRLVTPDLASRQYYVTGDFTWKQQAQDIVIARSWAEGHLPLWNPYIYAGQPLAADSGSAVFYPMDMLFTLTAGNAGVSLLRMEWRVVIDFLLAAALLYAFLRARSGSALAALGGTLLFTFSGYLTSYPPHQLDILETGTWLPLALLAAWRLLGPDAAVTRRGRLLWALVGGVALGMAFLAGHPQTDLLVVDATGAYALYLALRHGTWRSGWPWVILSAVASIGLAAAQLIPSLEFFPLSNRTAIPEAAARAGIDPAALPGGVLPHYAGQAELYVGAGALLLALAGAWLARRRDGLFWLGLAVLACLLSLGGQTPLYDVFQHLGFGLVKEQSRTYFLASFAVAVLATLALAEVRRGRASVLLVALAGVLTSAGVDATLLLHRAGDPLASGGVDAPVWLRPAALALVLGGGAALGPLRRGRRAALAPLVPIGALLALFALDGVAVNWNNNLTPTPPPALDGLPSTIAALRQLPPPFRVATDGNQIIPANDLGNYSLATDQGYNDFRLAAIDQLLTSGSLWRTWQLLDVHEFLTVKTLGAPYTLQHEEHGVRTYAVNYMLPAVWAVWQYQVAPSAAATLPAVLADKFEPGSQVILERAPDRTIPELPQHAQQVQVRDPSLIQSDIEVTIDQPAILVRSVADYPGWRATIDGKPAPILRADHAIQAITVPAGHHTVVFTFDPWSVKLGGALSLLSLLAVGAGLLWAVVGLPAGADPATGER